MTLQEAIEARHSVRAYIDRPLADDVVSALKARKEGVSLIGFARMVLGIVKYHFEVGAGKENFEWAGQQ